VTIAPKNHPLVQKVTKKSFFVPNNTLSSPPRHLNLKKA
jgi:DNA mismatch repair ATPase MutS